ncbi:Crp/Fnr family transcriptional regulator [Zunongwangia sp. HGR-M22]|uniref:Crp/Fnr family transcriptional regulator n=1 Tax=Zunongwangia sp. HGR-M22 TaxID=3015168 RepID=UPI0022DDE824|nr:Crp/Fnr family transcriptional regulator [Zunongwangia sp. HGR-M22]WBL24304.1 Crp/Fnr family transcriptional regulator [Zunongwangia sp. HGR-M22]
MVKLDDILRENFGPLTQEEIEILSAYFHEEKLNKGEFFTETNKFCKKLSILKTGLLRIYRLSNGQEITQWIATPAYLVTEISSFFFDEPSRYDIQALTPVALLTIDKTNYSKLSKELPMWKNIEARFIAKCFMTLEDRVFSHLSMTAEERYNLYFNNNKYLFNQVPLQYIASFLGMTPETFSRIRKRQAENS